MIRILKYIFLGIVQGLTEPLPVSSSGHTFILRKILDLGSNDLNFEIIVNFGSLLAILLIYKDDLVRLMKNSFKYIKTRSENTFSDFKYCILVLIGVLPIGLVGFLFKEKIENVLNNTKIIGISFLVTAIFLYIVNRIKGIRRDEEINIKDAISIGLIQTLAVFPGISRSGSTLIGGLFRKMDRDTALKYSFMLYIPISIGTTIFGISDLLSINNLHDIILPYGLGFIASFVVSFFTLRWFINIVKKGNLNYFSIYCLIIGLLIIIFL